jgi:hypothetical protein
MKTEQKVTFVEKAEKDLPWRKTDSMEKIFDMSLIVCYKSKISVLATVEIYMGKSSSASTMHCYFRLNDSRSDTYRYGYGSARGGGYCKKSASMANALEWAGIELAKPINGVGENAMKEAMEAIAKKLKYRTYSVI